MDYPLPNHIQPTRDGLGLQLLSPKVSDTGVYRVEVKLPMGIAKGVVRLIVHSKRNITACFVERMASVYQKLSI